MYHQQYLVIIVPSHYREMITGKNLNHHYSNLKVQYCNYNLNFKYRTQAAMHLFGT